MRLLPAALAVLLLAGCAADQPVAVAPTVEPSPTATPPPAPVVLQPGDNVTVLAEGLEAPWSIARLRSGSTLISERDSGRIMELTAAGGIRVVGTVRIHSGGEGGLLGLAYARSGHWLFAYLTSDSDNRIVRYDLEGEAGSYSLGASVDILTGLAAARNHNGGRIKIGPDGLLYVAVGDAGNPWTAQDLTTNNGKILRVELDGSIPRDNPFPGSLIYSFGHRNPQGLAWDAKGQLWSSELGQDTWDEFNRIIPGG
ncbi:MAG: PQQ-dependent sugar dehydrogenase, partial [Rhodoglobus sp.]|nr:PQQ-dependent sugar dehydrogenase [Rhodoglobus sp.]